MPVRSSGFEIGLGMSSPAPPVESLPDPAGALAERTRIVVGDEGLARLRAARGLGMGLVTAIPALRRGFMRQAAGLGLDPMPRLLTGRPL